MDRCKCGIDGGKHLYRDCPKEKEKENGKPPQAAAVASHGQCEGCSTDDLHIANVAGLTSEQLHKQLNEFFDSAAPAKVEHGGANVAEVRSPDPASTHGSLTPTTSWLCSLARRTGGSALASAANWLAQKLA